jgi:hypothetical protein
VFARPRTARARLPLAAAQQELSQPVPGAHQISAGVFDAAHQVAELLIGDGGREHKSQLAGGEQPDQPDRVTPIGLDPVPG